jgi:hypothetical protein
MKIGQKLDRIAIITVVLYWPFLFLVGAPMVHERMDMESAPLNISNIDVNVTSSSEPIVGIWKITDGGPLGTFVLFMPDGRFFPIEIDPDGTGHAVYGPKGTWTREDNDTCYLKHNDWTRGASIENGNKMVVEFIEYDYSTINGLELEKVKG